MAELRFRVQGMDCPTCATKIETAARRVPGIEDVKVSPSTSVMTLRHATSADIKLLESRVTELGYGIEPLATDHVTAPLSANADESAWWQTSKARLTFVCAASLVCAFALGTFAPAVEKYAFILAMLVGLIPIAKRAWSAARSGSPFSIEMLMTVAAVGAVFINAAEEAAAVVLLFLIGELLEGVAASKARSSIRSLTNLVPKTARVEEGQSAREIPATELRVGDIIVVRPGERIPADGIVLSGESAIDEAPVTGESVPVRKGAEATVFAGTINGEGVLRVKVTAVAADNTIARVVRLVEEAQESKAPTERFIDRFSRYYTPGVVAVALLVAISPPLLANGSWSEWIYKGLAILLIGCPCALVISTPAAIAASLAAGARRGLLLKGGVVLESLRKVTAVAFDKTGTLTEGKPRVTDILAFGRNEEDTLRIAAALESGSSHPLAKAILSMAQVQALTLPVATDARAIGGKGVTGTIDGVQAMLVSPKAAEANLSKEQEAAIQRLQLDGKTIAVLLIDNAVAGAIAMRDELRADAQVGLDKLSSLGVRTIMLTGDNAKTAEAVGKQLGIEVHAGLLPDDKQRIVRDLQAQGLVVAKVGDGINDAPALATADVGIAMGGGTDVALETADAAILHGRVLDLYRMIDISNRTMSNIWQNITIALGLKAVFLVTTLVGITGLWPAILADTGATVLVTLNALRLLRPTQTP